MSSESESLSDVSSSKASKVRKRKGPCMTKTFLTTMEKMVAKTMKKLSVAEEKFRPQAKQHHKKVKEIDAEYCLKIQAAFEDQKATEEFINVEMMRYCTDLIVTIQAIEDTVRSSRAFLHQRHNDTAAQAYLQAINSFAHLRLSADEQTEGIDDVQEEASESEMNEEDQ